MLFSKLRFIDFNCNAYEKVCSRINRNNGFVLLGCGSAVFAGGVVDTVGAGVGTIGVAMAFGLSVVAMAYTIGNISGCHINPAITLGVWLSGGMKTQRALMYMLFQVVGAIIGSLIIALLVSTGAHGGPTATGSNSFAPEAMG